MTCLPILSVHRRIVWRIVLCGVTLAALQGCATTGEKTSAETTPAPASEVAALPAGTVARKSALKSSGYSDPSVVAMAGADQQPMPTPATTQENAAAPGSATADLGDAVMQPTAINAGRSSIFAQQQEPMPAEATASTMTAASLVPAEMPTRRVSPMTGSLFSAPQYASADSAGLPTDEQVTSPTPEADAPADIADAPTATDAEQTASADPAEPIAEEAPAEPAKKTLFPILGRLLGKAKS
ncbi:hypothetical protein [Ciceribacter azotifigens]|uniref:hypothetical protein n=1 Tax=Ciceribacter azotifigens TaxID=2069303 RepID=UPI003A88C469